jgi:hypothetical protein
VSLHWIENPAPSIIEIEDGHVEDKHRIAHAAAAEHCSPPPSRSALANFCALKWE